MNLRFYLKIPLLLSVLFLMGACASAPTQRRYFWPPLPDVPKIEHLGIYYTNDDFPKETKMRIFLDSVLGEDTVQVFMKPWGIASDGKGKVYVTDAPQKAIVVFDMAKRKVSKMEGLPFPYGVAVDGKGNLYVSSGSEKVILVYDKEGRPLANFGGGVITSAGGLAVNDDLGMLYMADPRSHDIKVFNLTGDFLFTIGKRGVGPGEFNFPVDVDVSSKGELVVSDSLNARIQILGSDGSFIRAFGQRGMGLSGFQFIKGVAVDSEDHIYVTDAMGSHIKIYSMEGALLLVVGGPYSGLARGGFNLPMDIDIDGNDTIYVVDQQNLSFQVFQYMNERYLSEHPIQ